jgi:ribonuclease T1
MGFEVRKGLIKLALTGIFVLSALTPGGVHSKEWTQPNAMGSVSLNSLPREGIETYQLILQGGPFPYEKDGVVFRNRERLLPLQKRGYYREYTVKTPKAKTRGTRRIVCGGPPRTPDACFYTADHYASFRKIEP